MSEHTKGPWEWWTSNSFRRLSGADGKDGGVLHATVHRDGVADIQGSEADMALIAAAPALRSALELLRAQFRILLEEIQYNTELHADMVSWNEEALEKATAALTLSGWKP